jgi:alpha-glucosidase
MDPGIKNDTNYSTFSSGIKGNHFLKFRDGNIYIGKVWPGECAFPDFSQPETRDWWGEQMKAYTSVGVRGWWNDMNEPSVFGGKYNTMDMRVIHYDFGRKTNHEKNHNIYGMQMTQATYEGHRKLFTNDRPFILTRASFAGGQRWAAAWTGDNVASWEHLQMAIPMCLNLSVSGQPFVGSDIGGFIGSPDGELYARWLQLSIFTPLMRTHTVKGSADQEPWSYGEEYENINRRTIELRYRLLPYIYTQMWIASQTGIPPMRPLVFQFPKNLNFYHTQTEFMFGNDLFIAPVLWQYERMRELRLPNGKWYDFWSGTKYDGDRVITVEAPMDKIPIFVREGAIIPLQQVMQYSDEKPINPLTLKIFPSQNDTSVYYEDDGRTYNYEKGFYFLRKIVQAKDSSIQLVQLLSPEGKFRPSRRSIVVDLMGQKISAQKVYYGKKLLNKSSKDESELKSGEWMFNEISKRILIFIEDEFTFQEIRIEY